jgi:hypothetical protein
MHAYTIVDKANPRVGQNHIHTPYMNVYSVVSLPKIPYIPRTHIWFWPTLAKSQDNEYGNKASAVCRCRQLVSEQEVQARAADAARANVELHYTHIFNNYSSFMTR